jgi:hypothetical protein
VSRGSVWTDQRHLLGRTGSRCGTPSAVSAPAFWLPAAMSSPQRTACAGFRRALISLRGRPGNGRMPTQRGGFAVWHHPARRDPYVIDGPGGGQPTWHQPASDTAERHPKVVANRMDCHSQAVDSTNTSGLLIRWSYRTVALRTLQGHPVPTRARQARRAGLTRRAIVRPVARGCGYRRPPWAEDRRSLPSCSRRTRSGRGYGRTCRSAR